VIDKKVRKEEALKVAFEKRKGERAKEQANLKPWKFDEKERKHFMGISDSTT